MITIKNVLNVSGELDHLELPSPKEEMIDAKGRLTLMPALIDPHVHFRVPGMEHKEDWKSGAGAAIAGGITTVLDMPNNIPPCCTKEALHEKKKLIDEQLADAGIPLRYKLYFGADKNHLDEIGKVKNEVAAVKVFMGESTGSLLMDDEKALDRVFQICSQEDLIVAVHAEDEKILSANRQSYAGKQDPAVHSKVRDRKAAVKAVERAIALAEKYSAQLFILHVSTREEMELIRQAKKNEILVYAEVSPIHLFLSEESYAEWGVKVQVNPPLRTLKDQEALWEAIHDGTVDSIGSDHAPHTLAEKQKPYGQAPSGIPGIETLLPLLLNARHEGLISLEKIIALTRVNIENIYRLEHNEDVILVDLALKKEVQNQNLRSKSGWSPFAGRRLTGWPVYTILNGQAYHVG